MSEAHESVAIASVTILNLRKLLMKLRTAQTVQPVELEMLLYRAVIDLAGVIDYAILLETQLRGLDEKDRGVQPLG
jgi:hypothetical protein